MFSYSTEMQLQPKVAEDNSEEKPQLILKTKSNINYSTKLVCI